MAQDVVQPEPPATIASAAAALDNWVPTRRDAYPALVSFAQQAEANSWNRFYNFLMFSTILILAWSTIYSQSSRPKCASIVLALIAVVGGVSGVAWSGLGYRGRKYVTFFLEEGARIDGAAADGCRVCWRAIDTRQEFQFPFLGSFYVLIGTPLVFSALYIVLFIASLLQ